MLRLLVLLTRLKPRHLPPTSHLQPKRIKPVAHYKIEVRIVLLNPASDLPLINHVRDLLRIVKISESCLVFCTEDATNLDPCPDLALRPACTHDTGFFSTLRDTARALRETGHKIFDGLVYILAPPKLRGSMQD